MTNHSQIFSPLNEHVSDVARCFHSSSEQYAELVDRLREIQSFVESAEGALRQITQLAAAKSRPKSALEEILHLSMDNVGLTKLAVLMLDDINCFLESVESDEVNKVLDDLLGWGTSNPEPDELLVASSGDAETSNVDRGQT